MSENEGDLIVLVADKNMEAAVKGILSRPEALGIRRVRFDSHTHVERDAGCLLRGHEFLRSFSRRYDHCLVMFDRHGCGGKEDSRADLEASVEKNLRRSGWGDRGAAVVVDPELEAWVGATRPRSTGASAGSRGGRT